MVITPKNHFKQYPFVDREGHIQTFKENVYNIGQKEFSVLVYYGVAGIGKTSLRKELPKYLEEYNCEYQDQEVIWASIDLQQEEYRKKTTFLVTLKNELQRKSKIKFPAFEIAHAIYWKKAYPEIPLRTENYLLFEGDDAFDDFFGVVDKIPYFSLVPAVGRLVKSFPDYLRKWWKKRGETELSQLLEKEPLEIEECLLYFWAQDLNNYLEDTSRSAVLFIDTYEALWENHRSDGHSRDEWIREELIPLLPKKILWVICGKEAIRWEETKSELSDYLTQHEVKDLFKKYCIKYLETRGITDKEIQETIFKGSKGVPYYLELSADTYDRIVKNDEKPKSGDFGDNNQKIADRFFRYLSPEEKDSLNVLSIPHFWDYDLFEYLVKKFNTGYPTNNYEELCSFSFIDKIENNRYQMHQLMQESLQKTQEQRRPDSIKRMHKAIHEYYSNKLENIDIKTITPEHEITFTEAFYHAKNSLEVEEFYEWFIEYSAPFYDATFWNLLYPVYNELLQIMSKKMKTYHPAIANMLINLGSILFNMGKFGEANQKYEDAQRIYKKLIEEEPGKEVYYLKAGKTLTHLGSLLRSQGNLIDARTKVGDALEIYWELSKLTSEDDTYFSHLGEAISCLGNILADSGEQKRAGECYEGAVKIYNYLLEQSPNNVVYLSNAGLLCNNLGTLFLDIGRLDEAKNMLENSFKYYNKLLDKYPKNNVYKNILGGILNNLGASLYCSDKLYEAKQKYENALEIHKELSENDPENPIYKLNLLETLINLGSVLVHLRQLEESEIMYKKSLQILNDLIKRQPNNPSFRFYLGAASKGCGDLLFQKGQLDKAKQNYEKAIEIYEELVTEYPMNVKYQSSLGNALNNLGNLFFEMRRYNEALLHYKQALIYIGGSMGKSHQHFKEIEINIKNTHKFCNETQ